MIMFQLIFWLCFINTVWWAMLAFIAGCSMEEAWHCYHNSHLRKHLRRFVGYKKALMRKRKWVIFWGSLSLLTGLSWWAMSGLYYV